MKLEKMIRKGIVGSALLLSLAGCGGNVPNQGNYKEDISTIDAYTEESSFFVPAKDISEEREEVYSDDIGVEDSYVNEVISNVEPCFPNLNNFPENWEYSDVLMCVTIDYEGVSSEIVTSADTYNMKTFCRRSYKETTFDSESLTINDKIEITSMEWDNDEDFQKNYFNILENLETFIPFKSQEYKTITLIDSPFLYVLSQFKGSEVVDNLADIMRDNCSSLKEVDYKNN